jgi:hypothetical protein
MIVASAPIPAGAHRVTSLPAGLGGGMASPATGAIRLAGEHFAAAALYLLVGAVGLVWIAPELAAGTYLSPHVAGVTHLFTLGWLTTTIFGALYQLLPVALGAPIRWPRVGHVSFWTLAPGVGLFACGVADNSWALYHAGIGLFAIGLTLAVVNIAATLPRSRARDVTWAAIALALTFLTSTLGLGILLLHNLRTGALGAARVHVLATHLHVALIGWALMMMVGVSHRLLPMFLLAHGADTRWTRRAIVLLACGLPLLAVGLNTRFSAVSWAGLVVLEAGLAAFARQAWLFYRARIRKRLDVGMHFAAAALGFLMLAGALAPVVLALGVAAPRVGTAYVVTLLLGGIVLFIVGFFYKIVPLLAWTARYRGRMGAAGAPTVADMYSAPVARVQLAVMPSGVLLLAAAVLPGITPLAYAGAVLFALGVVLFVTQLFRVAYGRPVTKAS